MNIWGKQFFAVGGLSCPALEGCLASSIASTQLKPSSIPSPHCDNQHLSPVIAKSPLGAKVTLVDNHCS